MRPTRISTLVTIAVICALVCWLLLRSLYQRLPPLPWTGAPALLVAAFAEAWTARDLRARIAGRRGLKPAAPLFVSRMVALAKASSLVAAAVAGLAAGFDIYLVGSLTATVPRQDAVTAAVTFVTAVVLACAALFLEYSCRVPPEDDASRAELTTRAPWSARPHPAPRATMVTRCRYGSNDGPSSPFPPRAGAAGWRRTRTRGRSG